MKITEFLMIVLGVMTVISGLVYGFDREMARRDYENYNKSSKEKIVGCIYESNCKHYNDLLEKQYD